jgi:guanylate kinase
MSKMPVSGKLILISGPAGSGKTTLCDKMMQHYGAIKRVITATTRPPRSGELGGIDYYFLSHSAFKSQIAEGAFYEYARVHKNWYGTLKETVQSQLKSGTDLLLNIDVQGAASFRKEAQSDLELARCLHSLFIRPENLDVLQARLEKRGTEDAAAIAGRMAVAAHEIEQATHYDHCILTGTPEADFSAICRFYETIKSPKSAEIKTRETD